MITYANPLMDQQQKKQPTLTDQIVKGQTDRIKQRSANPQLDPGSTVKNIDPSIAEPNSFQKYYQHLATIKQIGQEQAAAAQAQAVRSQITAQNSLAASSRGMGSAIAPSVPSNPAANFQFAQNIAGNYGWANPAELDAWYTLGMKESGWRNTAQNPTSTAYGIGQFLDKTWSGYGIPKTSDPALQVEAMARYIKARYGSPSRALAFHRANNWY